MKYLTQSPDAIKATLSLLRHFRAFLASDCAAMRDPYDRTGLRYGFGRTLNKEEARRRLTWLIDVAINRKAGLPDHEENWSLRQFAHRVNTPRLVVREHECPPKYRDRLRHRLCEGT